MYRFISKPDAAHRRQGGNDICANLTVKSRVLGICGLKTEAVCASSSHKKTPKRLWQSAPKT
ncbi:MAG: hypothetical protein ACFN38_02430 [Campylobacter sp.]